MNLDAEVSRLVIDEKSLDGRSDEAVYFFFQAEDGIRDIGGLGVQTCALPIYLLHVIYKDADDLRASAGHPALKSMLRYDLPKENIDGEAVEWASDRLLSRPESRKMLIVLSDRKSVV